MVVAKRKTHDDISKNMYAGVFEVAKKESVIRFSCFKMADLRWSEKHDDIGKNM